MKYELVIEIRGTGKSVTVFLKDGLEDKLKEIENKVKNIKEAVCPSLVYRPKKVEVESMGGIEPTMEDTWEIGIKKGSNALEVLSKIKQVLQGEDFIEDIK